MDFLLNTLRRLVRLSTVIAGVGLLTMMLVTLYHLLHPGMALLKP